MTAPDRRPFRWPDALIVGISIVLGLAAAVEWDRWEPWDLEAALGFERSMSGYEQRILAYRAHVEGYRRSYEPTIGRVARHVADAFGLLPIVLSLATLGVAAATFRRPFALGRRSRRSLGVATTGLTTLLVVAVLIGECLARRFLRFNGMISFIWEEMSYLVGLAVLALWVGLRFGGVRRRPFDARDRMGRWLGWAWLVDLAWVSGLVYFARAFSRG